MIFDIVFPACHTAIRVGFSSLLYHEDVTGALELVLKTLIQEPCLTQGDAREERRLTEANNEANNTKTHTAIFA
jgi:hypothetical protein